MKHIIDLLRKHKVNKLYIVSSSPEIINENVYGIDIPNKNELICYKNDIKKELDVDDIIFFDLPKLKECIREFNPNLKEFEDSIFINNI